MVVRPYRLRCWEGEIRLGFGFDGLRTMKLFPYHVVDENRCVLAEDCIEADEYGAV